MFGDPPEGLPDDLTPSEYFQLALWYEESRQPGLARKAFNRVLSFGCDQPLAIEAQRALGERVTVHDIPQDELNKLRFVLRSHAKRVAEAHLARYPESEAGYHVLAESLLRTGDIPRCLAALESALMINSSYLPAQRLMIRALIVDMQYDEAGRRLRLAMSSTTDDEELLILRHSLEYLNSLETSGQTI